MSYDNDLRQIVRDTVSLGITRSTIADAAGYDRSRFIRWSNDPEMNITIDTADNIKAACIELQAKASAAS